MSQDKDEIEEQPSPVRSIGRPRSEAARQAILQSALELLQESGLEGATMDRIAARAQASKATIYRWWQNRESVIVDALYATTITEIQFPDTGSLREDFRQQMYRLSQLLQGNQGQLILTLSAQARRDATIGDAWQSRWVQQRQKEAFAVIQRGMERGELRPNLDIKMLLEILYSPLYSRLLMGEPITEAFIDQIVDTVMDGVVIQ